MFQTNATNWQTGPTLIAEGYERINGGPKLPLTVRMDKGMFGFTTRRGLEGSLAGLDRSEVVNRRGVFTWLVGKPGWTWQLVETSLPEYSTFLQPSRFKKSLFLQDKLSISKAVGRPVLEMETGTIASRSSFVLTLGSEPSALNRQRLWIDQGTGITLKRLETTGANEDYSLEWNELDTRQPNAPFGMPSTTHLLRGLIHPESFEFVGNVSGEGEYLKSLTTLRTRKRKTSLTWLQQITPIPEFQFVHTVIDERDPAAMKPPVRGNSLAGPELMPGGLPSGWTASGEVDPEKGTMLLSLNRPDGGIARILTNTPNSPSQQSAVAMSMTSDNPNESVNLAFVIFMAKDGTLVIAPGDSREKAEEQRDHLIDKDTGRYTVVRSDFLDTQTGDTLSFAQLNNRQFTKTFDTHLFKKLDSVESKKLGVIQVFELTQPYPITMIVWNSGDQQMLLTSTRLTPAELIHVAESASRMGP